MSPRIRYAPDQIAGLPTLWEGDVVVVGGGSAGSSAAIASARSGASTLVIESGGFLGGTGTRVLDTFYGFYTPGEQPKRVVGGIGWEVCERLTAMGMAFERPNTYGAGTGVTYEPEALKLVWDELVEASGARVILYGLMTGVILDDGALVGLVVETKRGAGVVRATVTIDATGDGEVSWRAGATTDNSSGSADHLQPATATFRLGGVSEAPAPTSEIHRLIGDAISSGTYALPRREGSIHPTVLPGVRHANMTRVSGKDLTDPWELTWAEQEGRRQLWEYSRFLHDLVPGYENSYLISSSSRIGIRESRRLVGEYVLSAGDFLGALTHDDDIAICGAPIEDHGAGSVTRWEFVGGRDTPDGATYGIPFGCLVPREIDGLLVAGRFFSASHEAHASARSIGQCTAMGQAAGTAAASAARTGVQPRAIDRSALRLTLSDEGAIV